MPWLTSSAISGPIHSLLQWELPSAHKSPWSSHDCLISPRRRRESTHMGIPGEGAGCEEESAAVLTSRRRGFKPRLCPYKAPLSMGFSRQEHWSGVPFPSPQCVLLYAKYYIES